MGKNLHDYICTYFYLHFYPPTLLKIFSMFDKVFSLCTKYIFHIYKFKLSDLIFKIFSPLLSSSIHSKLFSNVCWGALFYFSLLLFLNNVYAFSNASLPPTSFVKLRCNSVCRCAFALSLIFSFINLLIVISRLCCK